jgi:transcriptional regulator GlxA family with amidase domain
MIKKEYSEPDSFSEEAIRSLIATLIIAVLRYAPREARVQSVNSFIEKAVNYMHNNYQNPMPLDEIAIECDVSKVHLSREFKKKIGIGLSEYISIYRMKKAKELLLTRDKMSICEIAFSCGFNDSNYFSWLFKKTYGVTPSQYRKNTRE